jgi:pimeloyl-ACP methyl ester carboxylesterase
MARVFGFMRAHPEGFDSLEHAAEAIAHYLPHRRERKRADELAPLLRADNDGRLRWHWDARLLDDLADSAKHQPELEAAARAVRVPVLLISGGRSDLVSAETVTHFQTLVPHAQHIVLPEATHMLAGDDNDGFTRLVLDFLTHRPTRT